MWKSRSLWLVSACFTLALASQGHPIAVMTGDAVWIKNQLIFTMQIPVDQFLLFCQERPDAQGNIHNGQVHDCSQVFMDIVQNSFYVIANGDTISPKVTNTGKNSIPESVPIVEIHHISWDFEARFTLPEPTDTLVIMQTMGNFNRGLQATALITLHSTAKSELIPLYNNLPVTISAENGVVIAGNVQAHLTIAPPRVTLHLPEEWAAHGLPFQLESGDTQLIADTVMASAERANWIFYSFFLPEKTRSLTISWEIYDWVMKTVEMTVQLPEREETISFSRFKREHRLAF